MIRIIEQTKNIMNKSLSNFKKADLSRSPIFEDKKMFIQQETSPSQLKNPDMITSHIKQSYALLDSLQTIMVQKKVFEKIKNILETYYIGYEKK